MQTSCRDRDNSLSRCKPMVNAPDFQVGKDIKLRDHLLAFLEHNGNSMFQGRTDLVKPSVSLKGLRGMTDARPLYRSVGICSIPTISPSNLSCVIFKK